MADMIEAAKARLHLLRKQVEFLEKFVSDSEVARAMLEPQTVDVWPTGDSATAFANSEDSGDSDRESGGVVMFPPDVLAPPKPKRTRVTDNPKPSVLIPAAVEILKEEGAPMSRRQLHEALAMRGLVVKGSDPIKALGTILWRAQDEIVQLEGYGYWPKNEPFTRGGYDPELIRLLS